MAVTISNWDTKIFSQDVIKAFSEAGRIPDNSYMLTNTNESIVVYGNLASVTPANTADGATDLADAGNTETSTTVEADAPLKVWAYIPMSAISTHGSANVVANYAEHLGQQLRMAYEKRLANLLCTTSPTSVTFDDELTDSTLGTSVAQALKNVASTFDTNFTPIDGRYCLLRPNEFTSLYNVAGVRSSDFISGVDNGKAFQSMNFMGMTVVSYTGDFKTDKSADTNYSSKYRVNLSNVYGVAWHKSALACNWYQAPVVTSDEIPEKDCVLVKARLVMGTGLTRGAGYRIVINGDA